MCTTGLGHQKLLGAARHDRIGTWRAARDKGAAFSQENQSFDQSSAYSCGIQSSIPGPSVRASRACPSGPSSIPHQNNHTLLPQGDNRAAGNRNWRNGDPDYSLIPLEEQVSNKQTNPSPSITYIWLDEQEGYVSADPSCLWHGHYPVSRLNVQDHAETIKECHKPPYFRKRYSEIRKVLSSVYHRIF